MYQPASPIANLNTNVSPVPTPSIAAENPLASFIVAVERLHDSERDPYRLIAGVQAQLAKLIASPLILPPAQREPWLDHYRPHLLAVAPSRRFSVVALVWLPGQRTPIHDHICWCVVGVLEGTEREQRYSLREDATGRRWLAPLTDELVLPGQTSALIPPEENIHEVRNAGTALAISIHVYGADLSGHPSSVNQRFDDLPIRLDMRTGSIVPWRHV